MFGVVSDAVIPWILVLIPFIGCPFGLDGSVLHYKLTILNVHFMIKTNFLSLFSLYSLL